MIHDLVNNKLFLSEFKSENITDEYISWLNDKELMKFSRQRFYHHTKSSCLNYFNSFKSTDNLFFSINTPQEKLIGTITAYVNIKENVADIGILIGNKDFKSEGYGLSAWCLFQEYLFNEKKIKKITAGTLSGNIGMIKIIEKSNMRFKFKTEIEQIVDNQYYNELYYEKFTL